MDISHKKCNFATNQTVNDMEFLNIDDVKDRHYYLVRRARGKGIELVYNYMSDPCVDGTTDHDIRVLVFYEQQKWGLWGWNCGTSVDDFEQSVKFDEVLAEVSKEEIDSLFTVMKEATDEAAKWMDSKWKEINRYTDTPYSCMYGGDRYPYFTFWSNDTDEQVVIWSDLLNHNIRVPGFIAPDGEMGHYYEIPKHVFEQACALHQEMSIKFVHQYRDFVYRKAGVTIPIKEYTLAEIEAKKRELEERHMEMRRFS